MWKAIVRRLFTLLLLLIGMQLFLVSYPTRTLDFPDLYSWESWDSWICDKKWSYAKLFKNTVWTVSFSYNPSLYPTTLELYKFSVTDFTVSKNKKIVHFNFIPASSTIISDFQSKYILCKPAWRAILRFNVNHELNEMKILYLQISGSRKGGINCPHKYKSLPVDYGSNCIHLPFYIQNIKWTEREDWFLLLNYIIALSNWGWESNAP